MKSTIKLLIAAIVATVFMSGCYEQVPAGTKGKILSKTGFEPEIYPPSKVWLDNNFWNLTHDKLYLYQTTTKKV